jgi:hypothetical protein
LSASVAVPSDVSKSTVTVWSDSLLSVTSKFAFVVPASPSVTVGSLIAIDGSSSLVIVPSPSPSPIVAVAETLERSTSKPSSGSSVVSPLTVTVTVSDVSSGTNVTSWLCAL